MKIIAIAILAASIAAVGCGGRSPGLASGSFTAELNGFRIHYEVRGSGPVLMALPNSWGLSLEGLRGLYTPLEPYFTMVYFDPRGMGGSDPIRVDEDMSAAAIRADFDALRQHLGLGRVNAIGWSNGAQNLLMLAVEQPESLASAIFLHGSASFLPEDGQAIGENYPELAVGFGNLSQQISGDRSIDEKNAAIKRFNLEVLFPLMFRDRAAAPAELAEIFADANFSWRHGVYSQTDWPMFDFRGRLAEIRLPCLVLAGAHDMLPPRKAFEIHDGIAGSEFVIFDESGHFAPVEETGKFVQTVRGFIESLNGSQ